MVLSGTPYRRATAQMEFVVSMAITTSARNLGGYFRPRCRPCTVFLQYARFFSAIATPPLCRKALSFAFACAHAV